MRAVHVLAPRVPVHTNVTPFRLADVQDALDALRTATVQGAVAIQVVR